jgi:alkanesulfonate monooxygenase
MEKTRSQGGASRRTGAEAQAKFDELQDAIHPDVGVALLSNCIGFSLTGYPVDGPLPEIPQSKVHSSRSTLLSSLAKRENLTFRQLYLRMAGGRGHFQVCGSVTDVADLMQEWFTTGAADGFNFLAPVFPRGLDDFIDLVIPELQRRGLFRTPYEGKTLREKLGLKRPRSRYETQAAPAAAQIAAR